MSSSILAHFDLVREILLACDAVLFQDMEDGSNKPVAFVSHSLVPVEKCYAQLDKEVLAIIFGVTFTTTNLSTHKH